MEEIASRAVGIAFAALRSFVQAVIAGTVAWLASLGVTLPEGTAASAEILIVAVVFGAVVAVLRWAETIRGDKPWQRWVRRAAAVLMLGTSAMQPTYGQVQVQVSARAEIPPDGD